MYPSCQYAIMSSMDGTQDVLTQLGALSYAGIWVVSFLSNIVIPVPEEIVLLALGYISSTNNIPLWILFPLVISALLVNDIFIYTLSARGSAFVTRIYDRFFKQRINKKETTWMSAHVGKVVVVSRFLVQLRFIGPFYAGQKKFPLKSFVLYDLFALCIYVPLYILLGRYFHHRVELIIKDIGVVKNIILIIAGGIISYGVLRFASRLLFSKKVVDPIS